MGPAGRCMAALCMLYKVKSGFTINTCSIVIIALSPAISELTSEFLPSVGAQVPLWESELA